MIGERLEDRYEILEELGRGGMGVVYRAHDPLLERDVAVKMIPPMFLTENAIERFEREARLVAQMDHPAIVPIYDFGRHKGALYFVMPLVRGAELSKILEGDGLERDEIIELGIQVADALHYSHERGVIHRDIKPGNLMIAREGEEGGLRARVMDFGLARDVSDPHSRSHSLTGSLSCLSPEHVADQKVDRRSDIYSLGTVLYECLAGEPPFSGGVHHVLYRISHEAPRGLREQGVDVEPELEAIVLGCLAKSPELRPQTGQELARALDRSRRRRGSSAQKVIQFDLAGAPADAAPWIGRRQEMQALLEAFQAALGGEFQLVLVGGATGLGKSRLLEEAERGVSANGCRVLRGRFAGRGGASLQGFCDLIQKDLQRRNSGEGLRRDLDLSDLAPDLLRFFPALQELTQFEGVKPRLEEERPQEKVDLFEIIARTLGRLSGGHPLTLLLENLHEDAEACEALRYIVRRLGAAPILLIASFRDEDVSRTHPIARLAESFQGDRRLRILSLTPFNEEEIRRFAEAELRSRTGSANPPESIDESLLRRLAGATEGNPFFLRELIRAMRADEAIAAGEDGVWRLTEGSFSLPETIQQAVERRLDRLDDEVRSVLDLASVLGRVFDAEDLEELAESEGVSGDFDEILDLLIDQGILRESERRGRSDELNFQSSVVRDVLYADLTRRRRRGLHRKYARQLERRWKGRLERVYPQLVRHFSRADIPEETVRYALAMARETLRSLSADEAHWALDKAQEMIDDEAVEELEHAAGELYTLRVRACRMVGDHDAALAAADRGVAALRGSGADAQRAEMLLAAAEAAWQARRVEAARERIEACLAAARRAVENVSEGEFDADERDVLKEVLRRALHLAGTVAHLRGAFREAQAFLEEARRWEKTAETDESAAEASPTEQRVGGRLIVALPHTLRQWGPGLAESDEEAEISSILYENLLVEDAEGNPAPGLCTRWEASEDARRFVFELRADCRFSDGTPLTAERVCEGFEKIVREARHAPSALRVIEGFEALRRGEADRLSGLRAESERRLIVCLMESLPIFPAMLTDPSCAVALAVDGSLLGTGSFRLLGRLGMSTLLLERNPESNRAPRLDEIEMRTEVDPSRIATGLRSGDIDLARDLLPGDLESILRDRRLRVGLREATKKNTYFILFRILGDPEDQVDLRRALAGRVRAPDLVWRTLGRFARPAIDFLPPGMLGHEPARRHPIVSVEEARRLLAPQRPGSGEPVRLRAAYHPLFQDRFASLTESLLESWREIGVEVEAATHGVEDYNRCWYQPGEIDFLIGRWTAPFADPDSFLHDLFHSEFGSLRGYFSSPKTDERIEQARRETNVEKRVALYRRLMDDLLGASILLPLFHEIDYRIAGPKVRGLRLENRFPYVNFHQAEKSIRESATPTLSPNGPTRGELRIPIPSALSHLDPAAGNIAHHLEVLGNIFEPLTKVGEGGGIVPGLAAFFELQEARAFHFRLRDKLRFQDGRRMTTRDVRFTFERILRRRDNESAFLLLPIAGARDLYEGVGEELAGLRILSEDELVIELEQPLVFFPALLAHPTLAILPESLAGSTGADVFRPEQETSWREGCVGTGPFRVLRFLPGRLLELESNPHYRRRGQPRSERLSFHLGLGPEQIRDGFLEGRYSLASDIAPGDVETIRRDPRFTGCFHEAPRLSTGFLAMNLLRGPLADPELRRIFVEALDLDAALAAGGRTLASAAGLLPPGLLGAVEESSLLRDRRQEVERLQGITLRIMLHSIFEGAQAGAWQALRRQMEDLGIQVEAASVDPSNYMEDLRAARVDIAIFRWTADYADSDAFMTALLHSREGLIGDVCGSPEIDRWIDRGRLESSPALRHQTYREIENLLAREHRVVAWFHEQTYRLRRPEVSELKLRMGLPEVRYEELECSI